MITKMKYISLTGHIAHMNHVVERYLTRYKIELHHDSKEGLTEPFPTQNPYAFTLQKAEKLKETVGHAPVFYRPIKTSQAVNIVEEVATAFENHSAKLRELDTEIKTAEENLRIIENFSDTDVFQLMDSEFTHCKFGRLHKDNHQQYVKFMEDDVRMMLFTARSDGDYIWCAYFTPKKNADEVDSVFATLGFEVYEINLVDKLPQLLQARADLSLDIIESLGYTKTQVAIACKLVQKVFATFDIKRYASLSKNRKVFTFSGWVTAEDATILEAEMMHDDLAVFSYDVDSNTEKDITPPPTVLKNPPVIRHFEFFTKLYGLPQYNEIDPTPLLAVTYTLLFGLMFGDVGHGLMLGLVGLFIWYKWRASLGVIMAVAGLSAVGFGFLYGSIFGFEDVLPALWLRPTADISRTLILAASLGAFLIALSMMMFMLNALRQGRIGDFLFSANGVSGFIFYGTAIFLGVRVLGQGFTVTPAVIAVAVLPLGFIAMKPVINGFIAGVYPPRVAPVQFVFNTAIELFETLLTYATNTISFVRVGAFAVSHAGMMHVVLQLSQNSAAATSLLIIILGNVLVMAIEGLLVGIQVLRLDFYEIFSRFYTGGGRKFRNGVSQL